jgi:CheY-like chemotaxis protein
VNADERAELAHGLKTPLAIILGYAELLVLRDDDETRKNASEQITAAAHRLRSSIDSMLGLQDDPVQYSAGPSASSPRRSPSRVLIIDDDVFVRRLLRMTLPAEEFEIAEAGDGDIALAVAEAQRPELVLLDWCMPTVSGDTVLAELKERFPTLAVIVLTAASEQRLRAEELGADGFLTKPFSPLELLRTVEQLLVADVANTAIPSR